MPVKIEIPNLDDLIRRYVAGESEQKLANEASVHRWTLRQRLLAAGITPRNVSDSMYIRWANASDQERATMLAPAHAATRGREVTQRERRLRASVKQNTQAHVAPVEAALAEALRLRGYGVTQQRAIDIYNVDIALDADRIAVEIFGGHWHAYGDHARRFFERTERILNLGWHVVVIWVDGRRYPFGLGATEYLVAIIEEARRNPPGRSEYRVILGDGKPAPPTGLYFNGPSDIARLYGRADLAG